MRKLSRSNMSHVECKTVNYRLQRCKSLRCVRLGMFLWGTGRQRWQSCWRKHASLLYRTANLRGVEAGSHMIFEELGGTVGSSRAELGGTVDSSRAELGGTVDSSRAELGGTVGSSRADFCTPFSAVEPPV